MGETSEKLLEKVPAEKCWEITAKILITFALLRGVKIVLPLLGKGEGIISPIWGWEKWVEINDNVWGGEGGKRMYPMAKEMFTIPVENSVGAAKLHIVAATLLMGPELTAEIAVSSPEKTVVKFNKCPFMERYKECEVALERIVCPTSCEAYCDEGLKAINSKLIFKRNKALPRGDSYCEGVIEFMEEKE